jgi:hypothetical protein
MPETGLIESGLFQNHMRFGNKKEGDMADFQTIDMDRLRDLADQGEDVKGLMTRLSISDAKLLCGALLALLRSERRKTRRRISAVGNVAANPKYGKRGICLSPAMLERTGFNEGDKFSLETTDDRIILTRESVVAVGPL